MKGETIMKETFLTQEGLEALKYIGMECDCTSEFNEVQEAKQAYFIEGYLQAEKDLELTWEDIKKLGELMSTKRINDGLFDKEDYEEVLKRFENFKEKKEK